MNNVNNSTTHLFVYGTLRSCFKHAAHDYISQHFKFVGGGKVHGKLYDMGEYPAAIKTTDEYFIVGELYELKDNMDFKSAIIHLDDYEGADAERENERLYRREVTEVAYGNCKINAWIYWYNQDVSLQTLISAGKLFDYMTYKSKQ